MYCSAECRTKDLSFHANALCPAYVLEIKQSSSLGSHNIGVFSSRAFASYQHITTERMWVGVIYKDDEKKVCKTDDKRPLGGLELTLWLLLKHGAEAVKALEYQGFHQRRSLSELPKEYISELSWITTMVNAQFKRKALPTPVVTDEFVKDVFSIVQQYEYHLSKFGSFRDMGPALLWYQSKLNHSCNPNAMMVPFEGGSHLIALRPIRKDEEITVTYRNMMGVDSHRDIARMTLYQYVLGGLCQCGDALCVHKGMVLCKCVGPQCTCMHEALAPGQVKVQPKDLDKGDLDMHSWCASLEPPFGDEVGLANKTGAQRLMETIKFDLYYVSNHTKAKSVESPATQFLMLCKRAIHHQVRRNDEKDLFTAFVRSSGFPLSEVLGLLALAFKRAEPVLKESELMLATFEYELFAETKGLDALKFKHVPVAKLKALLA